MNDATVKSLDRILGTAPTDKSEELVSVPEVLPAEVPDQALVELTEEELQAKEDFEFSRGALKSIAAEAQQVLNRASDVAQQTDAPRAFESVAEMVRATVEVHRELQNIQKSQAEARMAAFAAKNPTAPINVEKGIIFSGTSEELLRLINPERE